MYWACRTWGSPGIMGVSRVHRLQYFRILVFSSLGGVSLFGIEESY